MTKLEIACVIIGLIGILAKWETFRPFVYEDNWKFVLRITYAILGSVLYFLMIVLPFYFTYWR